MSRNEDSTAGWIWPDSLDALTAAPRHHTLMFENDRVRVLDTRIAPPPPEPPAVLWSAPLPPHSLENVGRSEIRIISIELKEKTFIDGNVTLDGDEPA